MKVAFNARYLYDPGLRGFNRYSFCLLRELEKIADVEIWLLSEDRYPVHEFYRSALRAQVTNLRASRTVLWEQFLVPRYLRALKPDVFHAPADGGLPAEKACPYVLTCHGVPERGLAHLLSSGTLRGTLDDYLDAGAKNGSRAASAFQRVRGELFSYLYLRVADLVITVSEFSKDELVRFRGVSAEKVRVIYEAPDEIFARPLPTAYIEHVRKRYGIPPRFVLFVGGFDRRKNVLTLLAAFAELRKAECDVALVLVGIGGDVEGCRLQSEVLGLKDGQHVFFWHRVPDQELAALYRAASLFTTLSWHEGFCLPLVEAMSCGTPVLASSFGAIPEVLGEGGWIVDPRRVDEIVGAMRTILGRDDVRDELRSRALLRSKSFSWQRAAQQTLSAYKDVCSGCD